jgi:hypothetical protein
MSQKRKSQYNKHFSLAHVNIDNNALIWTAYKINRQMTFKRFIKYYTMMELPTSKSTAREKQKIKIYIGFATNTLAYYTKCKFQQTP